jgi:deoxycytidine triphosphate deaminase
MGVCPMPSQISESPKLAKILADKEIRKLLGTVILNGDEHRINPNGIEIRLGKHVLFQSTDEEKELEPDMFLKVIPGESVIISSYERVDFSPDAVQTIFPGCNLMAFITPTTTMMREGIMQSSTKVDPGFVGSLNWGLRNSSIRDFVLGFREPIFKLTFFLLDGDEIPETLYGDRTDDRYQNTSGILRSTRTIPASIPAKRMVGSTIERLDPQKQLREAGYPFSHIGQELTELHGKFEIVSSDVLLLKTAITDETAKLSGKVDESQRNVLDKVEALFKEKFFQSVGSIVACITLMFGVFNFLKVRGFTGEAMGWVAVIGSLAMFLVVYILGRKSSPRK